MSLANDFEMYFSGTYVTLVRDGVPLPFYVTSVEEVHAPSAIIEEGYLDEDDDWIDPVFAPAYNPYSVEAMRNLIFHGDVIDRPDGHSATTSVQYSSDNLILENPELGYILSRGRWSWLALVPQRSVKKGICGRRLNHREFTHQTAYALWVPSPDRLSPDLLIKDGYLEYKGVTIGEVTDTSIELEPEASYLISLISEKSELTINVKEETV